VIDLHRVLETAPNVPGGAEVALFSATSSSATVRCGWILSICLSIEPTALTTLVQAIWPKEQAEDGVVALVRWPFVQRGVDGWSIDRTIGPALARDFRESDPEAFLEAHRRLANTEQLLEQQSDGDATWYVRGRVAYYLAGLDPEHSIAQFGAGFAEAPTLGRTAARMWLSGLALRQEELLRDQRRELDFFAGFRAYVSGYRREARGHFERVIASSNPDIFSAIAMHLLGVLLRRFADERAVQLLREAVSLSSELGLAENEVMARHSLCWALVDIATRADQTHGYAAALELARQNVAIATATDDPNLVAWCRRTLAAIEWLAATAGRHRPPVDRDLADRLVEELQAVSKDVAELGDAETPVIAGNDAASIFRDEGRVDDAMHEIETTLEQVAWYGAIPAVSNLGKTLRSLRRFRLDVSQQWRMNVLVGTIERILGPREGLGRSDITSEQVDQEGTYSAPPAFEGTVE
jgi:hypothetical protein